MFDGSAEPRFVILLYHGVTQARHRGIENCSGKHLPKEEFRQQMDRLSTEYTVLPLRELAARKGHGTLPPHSVAVTFDDGFENNFSVAFPILKQFGIPATFFLSTGFIGTGRLFWVDRLEYLLNETSRGQVEVAAFQETFPLHTLQEKRTALKAIKRRLKEEMHLIEATLEGLSRECAVASQDYYEDYRTLTWEQVRQMHRSGLCDFGVHTVDHAILSRLPSAEKEFQIRAAKKNLEEVLGEEVDSFSYPEGLTQHFDRDTMERVKKAGFRNATTAIFGVNTAQTDDYLLNRNMVGMPYSFQECLGPLFCERETAGSSQ